jgi:sugar phosphate isomerase/epimerase
MALPPLTLDLAALPLGLGAALRQAADLGLHSVEVAAQMDRPAEDLEALADSGLVVAGAVLGAGLPPGCGLGAAEVGLRRRALDLLKRQVADAARLGAMWARLTQDADGGAAGPLAFAEACGLLAEYAAGRMVRVCLGHASARRLGDFQRLDDLHCGLSLCVADCRRDGEEPAEVLARAGGRLGCVCLAAGVETRQELAELAAALRRLGYRGGLVLGLEGPVADPAEVLRAAKAHWEEVAAV